MFPKFKDEKREKEKGCGASVHNNNKKKEVLLLFNTLLEEYKLEKNSIHFKMNITI